MLFGLFSILPFTICLFWTIVFLLDWRRNNAAQHVLTAFMGVSATLYLCHAVFFNHESSVAAISECIYAFCNIGVFPLYYLYICRLTASKGLSARHLAILIPCVVIGLWTTALNIFCPDNVEANNVRIIVMRIVFVVQLIPICWRGYRRLRDFDNEIANYYADTENRNVRSTSHMMGLLVGGAMISGIANFLGREYFDSSQLIIIIPSILFTILLFGVGYVGNRQKFCIDDLLREEDYDSQCHIETTQQNQQYFDCDQIEPDDETFVDMDFDDQSHIIGRLDKLMCDKHLYLHPDLRLSEVADILGVGRTTLSRHINKELQLSFSEYVNNLRIDYACRLLSESKNNKFPLSVLAEKCGFAAVSSFYRAFRHRTGKTPKQFIEDM